MKTKAPRSKPLPGIKKTSDGRLLTPAQLASQIGIGAFGGIPRAEALSQMLRENRLDAIKRDLETAPIDDALTLLVLLGLERQHGASAAEKAAMDQRKKQLSAAGKKGAETRHGKPGGARDLAEQLREIWATGKYSTRALCAEEEYAALGIKTFSTALKALRNTPDPVRESASS